MSVQTLFLRLEGPLQSWGITGTWTIRDTAREPTKSGLAGLICCAKGLRRDAPELDATLERFNRLRMGVRVDLPGYVLNDYHTVGAGIGCLAANGKIKYTESSGEIETILSQRFYLTDASFLVALQGEVTTLLEVQDALKDPVWPVYLGRKSCPPSKPVLEYPEKPLQNFESLEAALQEASWQSRIQNVDVLPEDGKVRVVVEASAKTSGAVLRQDVALRLMPPRHGARWIEEKWIAVRNSVDVLPAFVFPKRPRPDYQSSSWRNIKRPARLALDKNACVVCAYAAKRMEIHHKTYEHAGGGEIVESELCTLCKLCHEAVTMLEYEYGMGQVRIDPLSDKDLERVLERRKLILTERTARHPRGQGRR